MSNIAESLKPLAVPIDSIYCDPANARTGHDLDGIAASLKRYGQRTPVVANKDGVILKGNGTYTAAKTRLKWKEIAAVLVNDDATTATGYAIADNRLGDLSHFDDAALKKLLQSPDAPLDIPGIDAEFLASLDRIDYTLPENLGTGGDGDGIGQGQDGKQTSGIQTVYFMVDADTYRRYKQSLGGLSENEWFLQAIEMVG